MPPKAKITKELIIDAGIEIVRDHGIENLNARTIAKKLDCSTQPVMYHFKTIDSIKKAIYQKADEYHTAYITNIDIDKDSPLSEIGLAYIRFGAKEKNLFRFLFQSNEFAGKNIAELTDAEELTPVLTLMRQETGLGIEQTKAAFRSVFLFVHGYASMFANNSLEYDEAVIMADLRRAFIGVMYTAKEGLQ